MPNSARKIKSPSALPESFSVDKYAGTAEFTAADWAKAISLRYFMWPGYANRLPGLEAEPSENFMLKVLARPLATDDHFPESIARRTQSPSIEHIKVHQLYAASRFILHDPVFADAAGEVQTYLNDLWKLDIIPKKLSTEARQYFEMPVDSLGTAGGIGGETLLLRLNLECGDKVLVDELSLMLNKARKARSIQPAKPQVTKADMRRWHHNKALAYVDLTIWANTIGKSINQALMGSTLFPELNPSANNLGEKVRKGTKKAASELLSPMVRSTLWAMSRQETGSNL